MKIGPVDVRNHTFSRKMRGVDEAEVRAYMDMVADRLEEALVEAEDLRGQIDRLQNQLAEFHRLEQTLRDSLVSAERVSGDRRVHAEREADLVMQNAHLEADKVTANARQEARRLRNDIEDLKRQKVTYVERFRALLHSQSRILESSVESFMQDDDFADSVHAILEEKPAARPVETRASRPEPEARPVETRASDPSPSHRPVEPRASEPSPSAPWPADARSSENEPGALRERNASDGRPSWDRRDSAPVHPDPALRPAAHSASENRDQQPATPVTASRWPDPKPVDVPFAPWIASPTSASLSSPAGEWRDRRDPVPVASGPSESADQGEYADGGAGRITSYLGEEGLFSASRGEPTSRMDED